MGVRRHAFGAFGSAVAVAVNGCDDRRAAAIGVARAMHAPDAER